MPAPIEIQSPPADLNTLLHSAMPELEALHPERYVRRSVSRPRALELTNILLTSWAPLTDVLDMELSPLVAEQRKLELGRLSTRVWIFYKADLASEEVHANTIRKQRRGLARAVAEHDRFFVQMGAAGVWRPSRGVDPAAVRRRRGDGNPPPGRTPVIP
jgi:hypothetical protein